VGRHALLLGVHKYEDDGLHALPAVVADLHCLSQVLEYPDIGGFEVETVGDPNADAMRAAIGGFLDTRTADDVVLLYLSGHGVWSREVGQLYFAACDTDQARLSETAVAAGFVNDLLEGCRAHRKVLLLDCCFSGAYAQGFRTRGAEDRAAPRPDMESAVKSRGVYVITASDRRQAAYEGPSNSGEVQPSLFTGAVVKGLQTGEADVTGNGEITPDNLYSYVCTQVRLPSAFEQSPTKSASTSWAARS
jgi:uncharacterized caspase-like protein